MEIKLLILLSASVNISSAIARSHNQLCSYSSAILKNTAKLTASIVEWKDYRDEGFVIASRPPTSAGTELSGTYLVGSDPGIMPYNKVIIDIQIFGGK